MARTPIRVDQGKVTSRDPSLLKPGELTDAQDAYYKPNDPGIWKVGGRTAFNASAVSNPVGAVFLEYENGTDQFVIATSTDYQDAAAATSGGTFSSAESVASAPTGLDATHYSNSHYLHDGVNRGRVRDSAGAYTLHGMLANTTVPTISRDAGSGTGFTLTSGNTIEYWVEERVKSGSTVLRRNICASLAVGGTNESVTLTGDGTLDKPVITRPTAVNSDATHWALFATATNGAFPTGAEIAEVVIGTTTIEDTRTGTDPALPSGDTYETIAVTALGVTVTKGRNGPPPIATTGDIMEGSLVTDDVSDQGIIRYSWPDNPEIFPEDNYIRFSEKGKDIFKFFRKLGQIGITGMRDHLVRVNKLPRPEDAEFDTGRIQSVIEGAHGGVGPKAATVFSFGQGNLLAYVSTYGVHWTDGFKWDTVTDDVDWENTVEVSQLGNSVLINNPRFYRLEFYYTPTGGTANTACMYLHYHPSHRKASEYADDVRAKTTWPVNVKGQDAFVSILSGVHEVFTLNPDGKLYRENSGNSDDSSAGGISFKVRTGEIPLGGLGGHVKVEKVWFHHSAESGRTATVEIRGRTEGVNDTYLRPQIALDRREATHMENQVDGEFHQFAFENNDSSGDVRLNYIAVQDDSLGESEAG